MGNRSRKGPRGLFKNAIGIVATSGWQLFCCEAITATGLAAGTVRPPLDFVKISIVDSGFNYADEKIALVRLQVRERGRE
jgi:hypothetical protein